MLDFKTAAAYIRVSTDDQVELSPASQLVEIRKWAAANGYIVPEEFVFVDEAKTGRKVTGGTTSAGSSPPPRQSPSHLTPSFSGNSPASPATATTPYTTSLSSASS